MAEPLFLFPEAAGAARAPGHGSCALLLGSPTVPSVPLGVCLDFLLMFLFCFAEDPSGPGPPPTSSSTRREAGCPTGAALWAPSVPATQRPLSPAGQILPGPSPRRSQAQVPGTPGPCAWRAPCRGRCCSSRVQDPPPSAPRSPPPQRSTFPRKGSHSVTQQPPQDSTRTTEGSNLGLQRRPRGAP